PLFRPAPSYALDSAIPERLSLPARGILQFLSGGLLLRVGFCISRAMDCSSAWDSAIPGRWSTPACGILQFLSGGMLPRRDSAILGRWNVAARGIPRFLSGGPAPRVRFCDS